MNGRLADAPPAVGRRSARRRGSLEWRPITGGGAASHRPTASRQVGSPVVPRRQAAMASPAVRPRTQTWSLGPPRNAPLSSPR